MMGGTPYGRPMAMTAPARDGLSLDRLPVRLGPFHDALPPGMVLDLALQGDVVTELEVRTHSRPGALATTAELDPARVARDGLRWLAHGLHVHGLDADAARAAGLATSFAGRADIVRPWRALRRRVAWSGLRWTLRGVGAVRGHGDAADRWDRRLNQIDAAIAGQAGELDATSPDDLRGLASDMVGMTLSEVITAVVSFDVTTIDRTVPA